MRPSLSLRENRTQGEADTATSRCLHFGIRFLIMFFLQGACLLSVAQSIPTGPGRSPFLPPDWEATNSTSQDSPRVQPATGGQRGQYIFNGLLHIGDDIYFSVHDKNKGWSYLIEVGDDSEGVSVDRYSPDSRTIVLMHGGIREELALIKADGLPIGESAPEAVKTGAGRSAADVPPQWLEARERRREEMLERRRQIEELRRARIR